ncbi:MAG: 30S ribosomal protein S16 [Candidatus Omnitrophica bacterium]|nr:30S ribosomal protein S16 [Candidatus Omnitrophota bacterium]
MVMIRFQRRGTKKTPHFRIVATERSRAQSSQVLEIVGTYDPKTEPPRFVLDEPRLVYWLSSGAKVSESVQRVLKRFKKVSVKAA